MHQLLVAATGLGDTAVRSMCLQGLALAEANAGHLERAAAYGARAAGTPIAYTAEAFMFNARALA